MISLWFGNEKMPDDYEDCLFFWSSNLSIERQPQVLIDSTKVQIPEQYMMTNILYWQYISVNHHL
jgi:hypothetical protein